MGLVVEVTLPYQPKPTSQPIRPYPIPYIPPIPLPAPTLPYLSLPYQTPPHAKPPHPIHKLSLPLPYPALLCPALGKTWNGLEWNYITSSLKEHSLFIYNLPPTINPTDHLTLTHPPDHDPPPDIAPPDIDPRL